MTPPVWIADDAVLAAHCAQWSLLAANGMPIAMDTEFVRETTFYPLPGLLQLDVGGVQYLIDPLAINQWEPLKSLFSSDAPKVLHASGEDMEIFQLLLGSAPHPLYDTQVGAGLAGIGNGLGYQALVQQVLGVQVDKEHTRSNWLQRPLSAEQCHYAALDVAHLPPLFTLIAKRLTELGRFEWWREEGERALRLSRSMPAPEDYYRKLSAGFRLRDRQVLALKELCTWREQAARERNVPRGRILKDAELLEIAKRMPKDNSQLARIPDLDPQRRNAQADSVLAILREVESADESQIPPPVEPPLPREWGGRLNRLRDRVAERAGELGVAPEILARKRDCERLLLDRQLPEPLRGWRKSIIGDELLTLALELTSKRDPA
ncbi:MAG: ribonuclease D [Spongiibacteraceae bacterium]